MIYLFIVFNKDQNNSKKYIFNNNFNHHYTAGDSIENMSSFTSDLAEFIDYDQKYELNVGKSFQKGCPITYNQFKCNSLLFVQRWVCFQFNKTVLKQMLTLWKVDFTPASIDKNQEAKLTIGNKNDITIQVPHIEVRI